MAIGITQLIARLQQVEGNRDFHELDTIERLIVPVLVLAGWDTDCITPMELVRGNRSNRGKRRRFDLQVFASTKTTPRIAIECKHVNAPIEWNGYGWRETDAKDFLRQIRNDCSSGRFPYEAGWTIPVVTNGKRWILLTDAFIQTQGMNGGIVEQSKSQFILADGCLCDADFAETVMARLTKESANQSVDHYVSPAADGG